MQGSRSVDVLKCDKQHFRTKLLLYLILLLCETHFDHSLEPARSQHLQGAAISPGALIKWQAQARSVQSAITTVRHIDLHSSVPSNTNRFAHNRLQPETLANNTCYELKITVSPVCDAVQAPRNISTFQNKIMLISSGYKRLQGVTSRKTVSFESHRTEFRV